MIYSLVPQLKQEMSSVQTAHQIALEAKHATLDAKIAEEEGRPSPDQTLIADLKKRKLRLKEEMTAH